MLRHKLRAYARADAASLRVLLFAEGRRADDPRYYALPLELSLSEALRGKTVIEYPTLHVELLPTSADGTSGAYEAAVDSSFPLMPAQPEDERAGCAPSEPGATVASSAGASSDAA